MFYKWCDFLHRNRYVNFFVLAVSQVLKNNNNYNSTLYMVYKLVVPSGNRP